MIVSLIRPVRFRSYTWKLLVRAGWRTVGLDCYNVALMHAPKGLLR